MFFEFLRSPRTIGGVSHYSQFTKDKATTLIPIEATQIIELGPGDGNFTNSILNAIDSAAQLSVFELNEDIFHDQLNAINDKRLQIYYQSATAMTQFFDHNTVDCIISTIPMSLLDDASYQDIMSKIHTILRPGGIFITAQYSYFTKKGLQKVFGNVATQLEWRNLPPAVVLSSVKEG